MLQVTISGDRQVLQVFGEMVSKLDDMRPLMAEIGEEMVERTKQRFSDITAPDGTPWADNADSTIADYLNRFSGSRKKDGALSKKGLARKAGKKPLTGETGSLRATINYLLEGDDAVRIGSPMDYAPFQQYGTKPHTIELRNKKALAFGGIVVRKVNHPGIPARPFLGFSDDDQDAILEIVRSYLKTE
jgi:phage virion morphogenesis protein